MDEMIQVSEEPSSGSLNEFEAKQLLQEYGVPAVTEKWTSTGEEAVAAAEAIGYPVVVKGLGATLLHKTERHLVCLNLGNALMVEKAVADIRREAGAELEGLLVQPFVKGQREFVAGLIRDPSFGPVIMFGLGGVFAEALADVSFRLAPLTRLDAEQMIQEIKVQSLLKDFRGEKAVDRSMLLDVLMGLSKLAMERPDIAEVDINPLLADASGSVRAVDALVVKGSAEKPADLQPPVDYRRIHDFFHPKSIAFIGASPRFQKWGFLLPLSVLAGKYKGAVYMVNPRGGEIFGKQVYRSVNDIPGPLDLAVVTVPAAGVPDLIPQLQQKGIRNMLLITSGFRETGAEGRAFEEKLVAEACRAGILIVGPNTMGICNPHISMSCLPFPVFPRAGRTSLVCQSGNMGLQFLAFAEQQCIGIRGFCGTGNEAMVSVADYLAAFEVDPLTHFVMLYIEGLKDGGRFFETARRVGRKKPVILLKGGQSAAGKKAASSHTGAIASNEKVFNAACKQAGIVRVDRSRALLDVVAAFASVPIPKGNRVAIVTLGGGWGVLAADQCAEKGISIPPLTGQIVNRIDRILPSFWSRANPVDIVAAFDVKTPMVVIEELIKWDGCDAVIHLGILGKRFFFRRITEAALTYDKTMSEKDLQTIAQKTYEAEMGYIKFLVKIMETYQKPVYGVSLYDEQKDQTVYPVGASQYKGLFYPTPSRAVEAMSRMMEYSRFRDLQN